MAARYAVTLDEFAERLAKMPARLESRIVRGLRAAAQRGKGFVVAEIDAAQPFPAVDRGELRSSVEVERVEDGAHLFVNAPHAVYVEEGARPHYPPLEPIVAWLKRKKLDWVVEYMQAHPGSSEDAAREHVARLIQRHIGEHGTEPRWFFRKAMMRLKPVIAEEIKRALEQE